MKKIKKIKKMAAVIILILIAFIYGHIHKTHAIYDRTVENDQYIMLDGSQSQITQEFICEEASGRFRTDASAGFCRWK